MAQPMVATEDGTPVLGTGSLKDLISLRRPITLTKVTFPCVSSSISQHFLVFYNSFHNISLCFANHARVPQLRTGAAPTTPMSTVLLDGSVLRDTHRAPGEVSLFYSSPRTVT